MGDGPIAHSPGECAALDGEGDGKARGGGKYGDEGDTTARRGEGSEGDKALSPWDAYKRSMSERPLFTKSLTAAVLSALGELIGSALRPPIVSAPPVPYGATAGAGAVKAAPSLLRRTAAFALFGLVLNGPVFHWWYGTLERAAARRREAGEPPGGACDIGFKVAMDRLLLTPPYLAITLASLRLLQGLGGERSIRETRALYRGALLTNWKVWTVAQAVNFKLIPVEYRPVFGNAVACWWNIYLSLLSHP